ncbi:hypothetical protein CEXT_684521 [Caerostris extrusa]|uniref:Uncharacterized protein n=1 Tax=Caerostris extrusa TaxID=172846 RepID=A0AAV4Y108_CAEEX|nr:hypothetical protein CEXT_684521 [Caerostris extrusa]
MIFNFRASLSPLHYFPFEATTAQICFFPPNLSKRDESLSKPGAPLSPPPLIDFPFIVTSWGWQGGFSGGLSDRIYRSNTGDICES